MAKAVHKGARRSEATYPGVPPAPPLPEGGSFSCTTSPRPSRCLYSAAQASSPTMAIVPVAATECPETGELEFSPANANVGLLDKPFRKALRAWLLFLRSGLPAILHSPPRFSTSRMLLPLGVDPRKLCLRPGWSPGEASMSKVIAGRLPARPPVRPCPHAHILPRRPYLALSRSPLPFTPAFAQALLAVWGRGAMEEQEGERRGGGGGGVGGGCEAAAAADAAAGRQR